ncbi:MAG: glycogen synthase GlgA [Herminiimonas sp.]|nr:glycogen synthase GlgA [Herminiimonas sp.]
MLVLHVCAEVFPLLKTGGLADVTAALPPALIARGCDVRLLLPGFPAICDGVVQRRLVVTLPECFGASVVRLTLGRLPSGVQAYVIEAPELYDRPGNPYADANNHAYGDNHRRFALLGWVAAQLAKGLDPTWKAQVVHAHDWHAGLAAAYMKADANSQGRKLAASVITVHNLAYQGVFGYDTFHELGLPDTFFGIDGIEFHGQVSFLKAGLFYADRITTVSPTYAQEIQQPEQGCGLDGLLRTRAADLVGILNGVDAAIWSPARDAIIATQYDADTLEGKALCRTALQTETGLALQDAAPVFGVVSRLTDQKGLQLVIAKMETILALGGQLVLLGTGDAALEAAFVALAAAHPTAVSVEIGFDEAKAHRIVAGCDVILVPSHFEPCGLTQLYGLAYGTLPLVRHVGGLADSVVDCTAQNLAAATATGFVFDAFTPAAFADAVRRAFALFERRNDWGRVQQQAMQQCFGWDAAACKMLRLYEQITSPVGTTDLA